MNRSVVIRRCISVLIAIIAMGGSSAFAQQSQSCDAEEQAWVDENLDALPQTLREFLAVPSPYRKAVYSRLSPETKSEFWRAHLTAFLDMHPELSWEQKRALQDAIDLASPSSFRIGVVADSQAARALNERAQELHRRFIDNFGVNLAGDLVGGFGSATTSQTQELQCSCADASSYCATGLECDKSDECIKVQGGCGFLGLYDCDGLCMVGRH